MSRPRLAHQPALDGVRAMSVLAVLLFHGEIAGFDGGYLGVSVFFTLSGFLITTGNPAKMFIDKATRHCMMKQGECFPQNSARILRNTQHL